ncbi:expressed unknown protein [Seminavis robusta]|uniref:LRRK2 ARM repeat domain-containing protein n=1 Tax=Seminavis robusta TaxID=568900 RepID=A0A9N8EJI6_9STRA|nr:expressed unknown protein [Seminavis robusta]|eukprot:Sro1246_g255800.1 n/a (417) ;mRNA; f:24344-25594
MESPPAIHSMSKLQLDDSPHVHRNSIGSKPNSRKQLDTHNTGSRPNSMRFSTNSNGVRLDDSHRVPTLNHNSLGLNIMGVAKNFMASTKTSTTGSSTGGSRPNSSKQMREQPSSSSSLAKPSQTSKNTTQTNGNHSRLPVTTKLKNSTRSDPKYLLEDSTRTASTTSTTASDKENREEPVYLDEMSHLLLEELHHDTQAKVVIRALERLTVFCSQSTELCSQACHMGAPATIVNIMKKWSVQKAICAKGFRALIAMTVGCSTEQEQARVRKTLWMVGGVQEILKSMGRFPQSRSVQFFGCNALLSMLPSGCDDNDDADSDKIKKWMGRRFVREYKGVKAVISAMIQFEEDRAVQEAGCSVLLKLATFMHDNSADRKMMLESGAVSAFSVALESHSNDEEIQHYTTLFMNFMSGDAY